MHWDSKDISLDALGVQYDLRWKMDGVPSEPVAGMSESLADGLVTRFIDEWNRAEMSAAMRHEPPATTKRAAAYRALRTWLERAIPRELQIMTLRIGRQTGLEKSSAFFMFHWAPNPDRQWMSVLVSWVDARRANFEEGILLEVSRHALVRLFQRMKTTDARVVLEEAGEAITRYWEVSPIHRQALGRADILVPTQRGALAIGRDDDSQKGCVAKTWISDTRMQIGSPRQRAVAAARDERGFVLMANGSFVVLSAKRTGKVPAMNDIKRAIDSQLARSLG